MVNESEIKVKEYSPNLGGARPNAGRKRIFSDDVPATRKQIVLPDAWWESLKEMYPDSSFAMIIYHALNDHPEMKFD